VLADAAAEVVADVDQRYASVRSLRARFEQRYVHRLHARVERWRGWIAIRRPRRIRIDYERPRGRVVVSDGIRLIAFDPEPAPGLYWEQEAGEDTLASAFGLLDGSARIATEFDARVLDASSTGFAGEVLELRPRRPTPLYERVLLYVDRRPEQRGRVHRLMIVDAAGNTNRFDLSQQQENVPLGHATFSFVPPAAARRVQP
jgi:outer membrane lipoprotein carrier protein